LTNKYERDGVELKYYITLKQKFLARESLSSFEQSEITRLELKFSNNVEYELELIKGFLTQREPQNVLALLSVELEDIHELLEYNIDEDRVMEWLLKWQYGDRDDEQLFGFFQFIAHSIDCT